MTTFQNPTYVWDGKYENFPQLEKTLENFLYNTSIKFKKISPDGEINLRAIFVWMKLSNCPAKDVDFTNGWSMARICDQNDIDRPKPNNARYRQILISFEEDVLDDKYQVDVEAFSTS